MDVYLTVCKSTIFAGIGPTTDGSVILKQPMLQALSLSPTHNGKTENRQQSVPPSNDDGAW